MTIVAIHQPQYLPYLGFFHKIYQADVFVALDNVQFQKNGLQNRNKIKNAQGWQWLTVPILHSSNQLIGEVQINPRVSWARKHWAAVSSNYSRAPFFADYEAGLKAILGSEYELLCPLNMALIKWVLDVLTIHIPIVYASQLDIEETEPTERLASICQVVGGDAYLSGPGGWRYMDVGAFSASGIELIWQKFDVPVYNQLFPEAGFEPNLSIVDALFNCGPATIQFLQ